MALCVLFIKEWKKLTEPIRDCFEYLRFDFGGISTFLTFQFLNLFLNRSVCFRVTTIMTGSTEAKQFNWTRWGPKAINIPKWIPFYHAYLALQSYSILFPVTNHTIFTFYSHPLVRFIKYELMDFEFFCLKRITLLNVVVAGNSYDRTYCV